jgi:hypothetical protein
MFGPSLFPSRSTHLFFQYRIHHRFNPLPCAYSRASHQYLPYQTTKTPIELTLPRPLLAHLLAIRTRHGDSAWYHINFRHNTAGLNCSCGRLKTPEHMLFCRKTRRSSSRWLLRPFSPSSNMKEAVRYLKALLTESEHFETLLELAKYFTLICRR